MIKSCQVPFNTLCHFNKQFQSITVYGSFVNGAVPHINKWFQRQLTEGHCSHLTNGLKEWPNGPLANGHYSTYVFLFPAKSPFKLRVCCVGF